MKTTPVIREDVTTISSVATNPAVEERPKQTFIIPSAIETEVLRYDPVAIAAQYRQNHYKSWKS